MDNIVKIDELGFDIGHDRYLNELKYRGLIRRYNICMLSVVPWQYFEAITYASQALAMLPSHEVRDSARLRLQLALSHYFTNEHLATESIERKRAAFELARRHGYANLYIHHFNTEATQPESSALKPTVMAATSSMSPTTQTSANPVYVSPMRAVPAVAFFDQPPPVLNQMQNSLYMTSESQPPVQSQTTSTADAQPPSDSDELQAMQNICLN